MQVSLALSFGLRVGWRAARACRVEGERSELASHILVKRVLVQPDGWARGEREGYGEPRDVTSLSLTDRCASTPSTREIMCTTSLLEAG